MRKKERKKENLNRKKEKREDVAVTSDVRRTHKKTAISDSSSVKYCFTQ